MPPEIFGNVLTVLCAVVGVMIFFVAAIFVIVDKLIDKVIGRFDAIDTELDEVMARTGGCLRVGGRGRGVLGATARAINGTSRQLWR